MRDYVPFIDPRLHVTWREGMGHGVFSKDSIPKDTFVEIAPVLEFNSKCGDHGSIMDYAVAWNKALGIGLGWTMLYNHSDDSNCAFSMNLHDGLLAILSIRDIQAGEELTVDYGEGWFSSRGKDKVRI